MLILQLCIALLLYQVLMLLLLISSLGHERDRFEITLVISWKAQYVSVAFCGCIWGVLLGYLKENLDKF